MRVQEGSYNVAFSRFYIGLLSLSVHNAAYKIQMVNESQEKHSTIIASLCRRTIIRADEIMNHISQGQKGSVHEKIGALTAAASELYEACMSPEISSLPGMYPIVTEKTSLAGFLDEHSPQEYPKAITDR